MKNKEFTEAEALAYFEKVFESCNDARFISGEWSTEFYDYTDGMWIYRMKFSLGPEAHVYEFDVWWEVNKIYGEW